MVRTVGNSGLQQVQDLRHPVIEYAEVLAEFAESTWGSVTQPCLMSRCWRHNNSVLVLAVVGCTVPVPCGWFVVLDWREQPRGLCHACKLCCT
jgi:hypothetical protein